MYTFATIFIYILKYKTMPNYSLTVDNSRYNPADFINRIAADATEMEQEHRAAEAAFGELSAKANVFEKLANDVRGKDSEAYKTFKNYADSLRQNTDLLATQGMNPAVFRNIIQAKNDYSAMMQPIEEAWNAREKEAQRQAEYLKQHPDAMFERDAYQMGIDQWMKNPHYIARSIDKNAIATRAAGAFSRFKKKLQDFVSQNGLDPNDTKSANLVKQWVKAGKVPWLYQALEKYGVNPDDIDKILAGNPEYENHILNKELDELLRSSGVLTMNTDLDHFTREQNIQNRTNKLSEVYSTLRSMLPYTIGEDKFDKYQDDISGDLAYKYAALEQANKQFYDELEWKKQQALLHGGGDEDPKVHTYYRDVEYLVPNEETQTTKAAQLLALKNLLDKNPSARTFYRGFAPNDILNTVKNVFGKDITEIDFDDDTNDNKLREALYNNNRDSNGTYLWSDSFKENEEDYKEFMVNNYINNTFDPLRPLTKQEADELMKQDMSTISISDKKRLYKYLYNKSKGQVYVAYDSNGRPIYSGVQTSGSDEYENLYKDVVHQLFSEMSNDETNPYDKMIDDLIGTNDNDIYDYNTRVNNYIKGATTAYEGAEDNFEGSARTNQSSLLWGQSLQGIRKGSKDIALNVHTLDANGNKVDVKQKDVVDALGINKNGEITRPYRMSIIPLRNKKTGEMEVHPMIRTQGYSDDGTYHEGIDFEWNHSSIKENKETRDTNLKQMNLNLNKAENVKKSKEFKKIVANAESVAKNYLESEGKPLTRKNISDAKYAYIKQELERLQKPYIDAYNFHKSEFMRLWGHATGNTNIANSINHNYFGELDGDFHIIDLGANK